MENAAVLKTVLRPAIKDIEAAIRIYYSKDYIGNKDMRAMFGDLGTNTYSKLKNAVREEEVRREMPIVVPNHINTEVAYEVWNIDIKKLVDKRARLKRLGMLG